MKIKKKYLLIISILTIFVLFIGVFYAVFKNSINEEENKTNEGEESKVSTIKKILLEEKTFNHSDLVFLIPKDKDFNVKIKDEYYSEDDNIHLIKNDDILIFIERVLFNKDYGNDIGTGGDVTRLFDYSLDSEEIELIGSIDGKNLYREVLNNKKIYHYYSENSNEPKMVAGFMEVFPKDNLQYDGVKVQVEFTNPNLTLSEKKAYAEMVDKMVMSMEEVE